MNRYNWKPDLPDGRDYLFSERMEAPRGLPPVVDLTSHCSPVFNQGQIGSCTGNALAGALEFLEKRELHDRARAEAGAAETYGKTFSHISRLFIYYNERALEGTPDQDSGGRLRDGIKTLADQGACRESLWKYSATDVFTRPSAEAYAEALGHRISSYLRVQTLDELRASLADGYPVAFGFSVYESFESPAVAKSGVMPMPQPREKLLGGHAVLAVGYDDPNEEIIVRNSWGPEWGQKGYFRMPYGYLTRKLAQDFWTIRK